MLLAAERQRYVQEERTKEIRMEALPVYQRLEDDFVTPAMSDDWARHMHPVADFLSDNFKNRSMGVVCDFTTEINRVYTAVFPSNAAMQQILDEEGQGAMLFVHHASTWDIRKAPEVFQQMNRDLIQQFKQDEISIYCLHVPLDNWGEHSTSITLAKALGIGPKRPFAPYLGAMAGVFGSIDCSSVQDMKLRFQEVVGHDVSLYNYGDMEIKDGTVAVIAGGGNTIDTLKEIADANVNTLITGIAVRNEWSEEAHEYAEKHRLNILGGTHYSTEKFACISMTEYFRELGLPTKFIADEPVMEDM